MSAPETIVAISTPPGRGGIGVVRLSGARALEIARKLIKDADFAPAPHQVKLKKLYSVSNAEFFEQSLITYFQAPQSFTGEDVVEFSCHGSPVLLRRLLDEILACDARLAEAGEFTLRALQNGRLNLSQAEAIRDLIDARTQTAARHAARQLEGELSAQLQPLKQTLIEIIVPLESSVEFVEDDLPQIAIDGISAKLDALVAQIDKLVATYRSGKLIRDGLKVALVGRPNAGKSSLFNALLAEDRAIVTAIPGTTRDALHEFLSFDGIPVRLTDTAGVREASDEVEALGIERTRRIITETDLTVLVLDGTQEISADERFICTQSSSQPLIIALNKKDLASFNRRAEEIPQSCGNAVEISAKTGEGLDELRRAILAPFASNGGQTDGMLITDARHHDLLNRTRAALIASQTQLCARLSEELVLIGLYAALRYLGEITGETTPDDVLGHIFSTFCIGK